MRVAKKNPHKSDGKSAHIQVSHGQSEDKLPFPVVGVGASAGGLEAFQQLIRSLPADTGMGFVLIQHLSPTHESALAEILSRETSMAVVEVTDEPVVQANTIYVIPPGRNMTIEGGKLRLFKREEGSPQRPVDQFLSSLAEDQGYRSVGIILSGTGTDGTLGLEEIKASGGITFAQDATAKQSGMPRSAVDSGCVDLVLPPEGIAREIAHLATHPYVALDVRQGDKAGSANKADLAPILRLLTATNVDFSLYKASTLVRRITRRMILLKLDGLKDYFRFLRTNPEEVQALYQDILINVTGFFRDPAMYEQLKSRVVPKLLEGRSPHDPIRVWVLGCSTGEEAYSMAMTLAEATDSMDGRAAAQIFATDLNVSGIERARAGIYSDQRLEDVSPERIRRFFVDVNGVCQVSKLIRDMCVFAQHNVMSDPPFSRIDIVSCRNMLIYMEPALQERILPVIHYALKPGGCLVLGSSETVGQSRELFDVVDGKHKIFRKKPGSSRLPAAIPGGSSPQAFLHSALGSNPVQPARVRDIFDPVDLLKEAERFLMGRFAPPSVLVNGDFQILQFSGDTEPYLVQPRGKPTIDLLRMAREGLAAPLRAAANVARSDKRAVRQERLRVNSALGETNFDLEIIPLNGGQLADKGFLVLFEELAAVAPPKKRGPDSAASPEPQRDPLREENARLKQQLASTNEYLQSVIEQHEAAAEELQSANEEAQSANEELQSINEELETSKEELQSSNEELATVNDELQNRNAEVARVNSDLNNLIESVNVAIVIVDRELHIRSFTPEAQKALGVVPADIGRPIGNIRMNLAVENLDSLIREVIAKVNPKELEVQSADGNWFSLRVKPYLTLENKIDGAVLLVMDIKDIKAAELVRASLDRVFREELEVEVAERTRELATAAKEAEGFSYSIAHDLRTPLRALIFASNILVGESRGLLSAEHQEMLVEQGVIARKLATLVDELLQFSQISRTQVKRKDVDLSSLAHQVAGSVSKNPQPSPCAFSIQEGLRCEADPVLLEVVLTNLIDNACKFSPQGGVVTVGRSLSDEEHPFYVRDEGIGFDPAFADKVFLPFERLHHDDEYPGTGIGLATVKRIVERHGGRVWVQTATGHGTTVFFTLKSEARAA